MNTVYVIAPSLTVRTSPVAEAFLEAFHRNLLEYGSVSNLRTASALLMTEPDAGDVVVFFNRPDTAYESQVLKFLEKTKRAGAEILPVAATKEERQPPALVEDRQSFDVVEQLRQRALDPSQVTTIATVFARQVLSILKPTLAVEPMHLFLSYRRFDGEEIAASFHRTLINTTQKAFRDLFDVRMGMDAQEIIEARLRESDAVIFLDTPKAGESPWIIKELQMALSLQLPIVWVRIGPEDGRIALSIMPAGTAHFAYSALNPATDEVASSDVEKIVHKAFEIHRRDYVDRLMDELGKLKELAHQHGIQLHNIDPRRMIYTLTLPRRSERYRERPLTHLLQFFGRTPTKQDLSAFSVCAKDVGYEPHPKHGPHYDSAILLAAVPSRASASFDECGVHTDSVGDYVTEIQRFTTRRKAVKKRLVISGAFADCEPEYQQNMTNAVHAVTETSLRGGLGVSFGAHPTFQFMIFDLAKRLIPGDYLSAVRMYVSRFFVTAASVAEFRKSAEVVPVDAVGGDRAKSLTAMRQAMFNDAEAGALVVIGGKTARGGHSPGVDEEIQLARKAGLPIYIFGSVGGRSSELSAAMSPAERATMNGLSEAANEDFATSLDYSRLAKLILDSSF
jgi:hypothetical protein